MHRYCHFISVKSKEQGIHSLNFLCCISISCQLLNQWNVLKLEYNHCIVAVARFSQHRKLIGKIFFRNVAQCSVMCESTRWTFSTVWLQVTLANWKCRKILFFRIMRNRFRLKISADKTIFESEQQFWTD